MWFTQAFSKAGLHLFLILKSHLWLRLLTLSLSLGHHQREGITTPVSHSRATSYCHVYQVRVWVGSSMDRRDSIVCASGLTKLEIMSDIWKSLVQN